MAADKDRGPGTASAEIGKYLDILAKDPHSRVFAPLAEAYRKAGLVDDAIATALEGLKIHPNYLGGRVALGRAYFEKGRHAEAAAEMRKVVGSAPDNLMAHRVLGQIARAQNDPDAAEKAFRMVLLLDPGDQEARQFVAGSGSAAPSAPVGPAALPPVARPAEPAPPSLAATATQPAPAPFPPFVEIPPLEAVEAGVRQPSVETPAPALERGANLSGESPAASPPAPAEEDAGAASAAELPAPPDTAEVGIDLSEGPAIEPSPNFREEELQPPPPGALPEPAAAHREPVSDEGMQLEVFTRVAGGDQARDATAAVPPETIEEDRTPYREISFAHDGPELQPDDSQSEVEPPFEIFARESAIPDASPTRAGRAESGVRDIEIETTAYLPSEVFEEPAGGSAPGSPEDELPLIDLAREMEPAPREAARPSAEPSRETAEPEPEVATEPPWQPREPEPEFEAAPAFGMAPEPLPGPEFHPEREAEPSSLPQPSEPDLEPQPEPWREAEPEAELEAAAEAGRAGESLGTEPEPEALPAVGDLPAGEHEAGMVEVISPADRAERYGASAAEPPPSPPAAAEEEYEELTEEEPSEAPSTRGVFDTETLAAIYVDQGFYGRAADIYRRLLVQRPGDGELRRKLEELSGRQGGEEEVVMAAGVVAPAPVPAAAAAPAPQETDVVRLERLLEAFRGGRPR